MYMKLRVWWPLPQISISCLPLSFASITLRQIAAGAFSRPPSHVPLGAVDVVEAGDAGVQAEVFWKWRHMRSLKSFSQP